MFSCKNYLFAKAQITFLLKGTILSSNAELLQVASLVMNLHFP